MVLIMVLIMVPYVVMTDDGIMIMVTVNGSIFRQVSHITFFHFHYCTNNGTLLMMVVMMVLQTMMTVKWWYISSWHVHNFLSLSL